MLRRWILSYDQGAGAWVCTELNAIIDQDADGVLTWDDCNDNDPAALSNVNDLDCDGINTADDCDDNNPASESIFTDAQTATVYLRLTTVTTPTKMSAQQTVQRPNLCEATPACLCTMRVRPQVAHTISTPVPRAHPFWATVT